MKLLVGIVALYITLCQAAPGWKAGKKYVYEYIAKVGSGVSDEAVTQFAGKGMKANLHVYLDGKDLALEYHDVKTDDFNRKMESVFESLELNYQPMSDPTEQEAYENVFKFPFYGVYGDNGKIVASKHKKDGSDQMPKKYSNIQRAALSLFQLVFPSDKSHVHYYTVDEYGIGGHCNASYAINHHPDDFHPSEKVMNITKNYLYDECTYSPHWFFSSWHGGKCQACTEQHFHPFRHVGRVDYEVRGDRAEYTIERIDAFGYIGYTPFTDNGQTAMSMTNQTLVLISVEDYTPPSQDAATEQSEGLHYEFGPENSYTSEKGTGNLKFGYEYFKDIKDPVEHAGSLVRKFMKTFHEKTDIALATKHLVHVLGKLSESQIEQFFTKNIDLDDHASPKEKAIRNYALQLLAIVGTPDAIAYLVKQIENKNVPSQIAIDALAVLPLHAKSPSLDTFQHIEKLLQVEYINSDPSSVIFSAVWMAYGTLISKACVKYEFNPHPPHAESFLSKDHCESKIKVIVDKLHAAESGHEKTNLLRALMDTGSETAINIVKNEAIPNPDKYDLFARVFAVSAGDPEVLLPIVLDHNEDTHLRIKALQGLPFDVLVANAFTLTIEEPNNQVASFVWSTFASLANSTDPCDADQVKEARHILPYITPKDRKFDLLRHSNIKKFSYYNEQFGYGNSLKLVVMGSNDTAIPREFFFVDSMQLGGYSFVYLDVSFVQRDYHELDSMIALATQQFNLILGPKTGTEDFGLSKHYNLQKFASSWASEISTIIIGHEAHSIQNMKFPKDNPYITLHPDNNKVSLHHSHILMGEIEYVLPNLLGLPTYLHLNAPGVFKLSGTAGLERSKVGVHFDLDVILDAHIEASIFVDIPNSGSYGFQLRTDATLKHPLQGTIELDLDPNLSKLKITEIVSEEPYDFLRYDTQPYTFTKDHNLLPIKYSETPVESQYKIGHNYFGAGFKVQVKYDKFWNDYGYYKHFVKNFFHKSSRYEGNNDFADKLYAGLNGIYDHAILNPKAKPFHLNVRFERSTKNPTEEVHTTIQAADITQLDNSQEVDLELSSKKITWQSIAKGPTERKWSVDFELDQFWNLGELRHMKFKFDRSPIPNYDDKPYEVCFDFKANPQGVAEILENPLEPAKKAKLEFEATLNAGESCGSGSKQFNFKAEGTQSEEQKSINHDKLEIYQQCKKDYAKGYELSYSCWKVKLDQGQLNHWTFDLEYDKNVNPKVKQFFYRLYYWFRHRYYTNMQVEPDITTGIEDNHVRAEVNFSYFQPIMDVHVTRPHEKVHYNKIFVPTEPSSIVEPLFLRIVKKHFGRISIPTCYLSGDYIQTLDGVQYKYALGKCWHIAVANSLRENVVLLFRGVSDGKYTKALRLLVENTEVVIEPKEGKLLATVDGNSILEKPLPHYVHKTSFGMTSFVVYQKLQGYVIVSRISGLKVYFDGRNAEIMVSNFYHGIQNGICGDFNNERYHEFRGIDGTLYKDGAEFANSYAVHKDDCQA